MSEVIVFPDVEGILVSALNARLDEHVSTKVPNPRPASFVRLVRVGGNRRNVITDRATVVFECWAASNVAAERLCALVRAHVHALAPDTVRRVREVAGPQSFPDPLSESPRYQFTAQIDTRGAAL